MKAVRHPFSLQALSVLLLYVMVALALGYAMQTAFAFERRNDDDLMRDFLEQRAEDTLRIGSKPVLWIPLFRGDLAARTRGAFWSSFLDRTVDGGATPPPTLQLTLRTIERANREEFQIVLVDDSTFPRFVPRWRTHGVRVEDCADEDARRLLRAVGLLELVAEYGGIVVPPSLICSEPLTDTYREFTEGGRRAFFAESLPEDGSSASARPYLRLFGAGARDPTVEALARALLGEEKEKHEEKEKGLSRAQQDEWMLAATRRVMTRVNGICSEVLHDNVSSWIERAASKGRCRILPGELVLSRVAAASCSPTQSFFAQGGAVPLGAEEWIRFSSDAIEQTYAAVAARGDRVRAADFPFELACEHHSTRFLLSITSADLLHRKIALSAHLRAALFLRASDT